MLRTIKQLAELAGVSDAVVRSWVNRRDLPMIKIGGRIYIQDEEYANWLAENKIVIEQKKERSVESSIPQRLRTDRTTGKTKRIY